MDSRRSKIILAFVIMTFVFGFVVAITRGDRSRDLVLRIEPIDPDDEVTVYVGGSVSTPGLYSLPRGSRVAEALDMAGLLDMSETSTLDLARVLDDEQSVIVPEKRLEADDRSATHLSADAPRDDGLIDINMATETELQTLPGIGPAISQRILEHREHAGPFGSLDDLSQINGISERMVDELRSLATVGQ